MAATFGKESAHLSKTSSTNSLLSSARCTADGFDASETVLPAGGVSVAGISTNKVKLNKLNNCINSNILRSIY